MSEQAFLGQLDPRRQIIADFCASSPMFDVIVKPLVCRRLVDEKGHELFDFATQDYLGFDFDPEVIEAAVEATRKYGTVIAWCRLVATVDLCTQVERATAQLCGSQSASLFASTTLLNHGVIPALLGRDGVLFLEKTAHATMYEAAKMARDSGSPLVSFVMNDLEELEEKIVEHKATSKKLICVDGVNSMTGEYARLPELTRLAEKHDAILFVDDAHGFGVVGENPSVSHPYGQKGNGLVRHCGVQSDHVLYVGCFSKAYGSFGSFLACSERMQNFVLSQATPHDLGGAGPASSMAAILKGFEINASRGDALRSHIFHLTEMALAGLRSLGFVVLNQTQFPILSVWLGDTDLLLECSKILYEHHVLLTLSPYPMVRRGDEAFRVTITATNTEEEIGQMITAFGKVRDFLNTKQYDFRVKRSPV